MTTAPGDSNGAEAVDLRFLTRDVTAEEAAAVTAVVVAAVGEEHGGDRSGLLVGHAARDEADGGGALVARAGVAGGDVVDHGAP